MVGQDSYGLWFDNLTNLGKKLYWSGIDFERKKVRSLKKFKTKIHMGWFRYMVQVVRILDNLREKLNWCGLDLGGMLQVSLEFFRFETGLFWFMID